MILTLGHLLGPQSDLHAVSAHDHGTEQDHPDAPSHDHGAHVCGLAIAPDSSTGTLDDAATELAGPDCVETTEPSTDLVDVRDRSPTDPVARLQVNRV